MNIMHAQKSLKNMTLDLQVHWATQDAKKLVNIIFEQYICKLVS